MLITSIFKIDSYQDKDKTKTFPYAKSLLIEVEKTFSQGSFCKLPGVNRKGRWDTP